jgi:hypothetical protein
MSQKRQPKGTDTGGQFAASANPESTVELSDELTSSPEPRGTAQKIAARLQKGTRILCVENTYIPNTPGVIIEISKAGARAFTGVVIDPADRENLKVGDNFAIDIGTGASLDGNQFSSNIAINGETKGRSTWEFLPDATDAEFDDELDHDSDSADKQQYIDSIHKNLDDSGNYDPNDEGVELINESSMKITGELETLDGIAWTGELTIGDEILYVSNDGNGGSNRYESKDGGWKRIEELNDRVSAGFPGLAGAEALDGFCLVAEVARLDRLSDET